MTMTKRGTVLTAPSLSRTRSTTVLVPSAAVHEAATVVVTVPLVLVRKLNRMPGGAETIVTNRLPAGS